MTLGERIRKVRGDIRQDVFAEMTGTSLKTLQRYEMDQTRVDATWLAGVCKKFPGIDSAWLLTGTAESHVEVLPQVPRYDLQLSAGSGAFIDRAQLLDHIPFTPAFLRRKLGRSTTDGLVMLEARGDSMEPTLGNGDLVMVDMRERDLQGGLMAFVYNDTAFIKRLRPLIGGVEIISDNADLYKPELIDRAQLDELQIIGRVRWIGRVV